MVRSSSNEFEFRALTDELGVRHLPTSYYGKTAENQLYVLVAIAPAELAVGGPYLVAPPKRIEQLLKEGVWTAAKTPWDGQENTWKLSAYALGQTLYYVSADRETQCIDRFSAEAVEWPNPFVQCGWHDAATGRYISIYLPAAASAQLQSILTDVHKAILAAQSD